MKPWKPLSKQELFPQPPRRMITDVKALNPKMTISQLVTTANARGYRVDFRFEPIKEDARG